MKKQFIDRKLTYTRKLGIWMAAILLIKCPIHFFVISTRVCWWWWWWWWWPFVSQPSVNMERGEKRVKKRASHTLQYSGLTYRQSDNPVAWLPSLMCEEHTGNNSKHFLIPSKFGMANPY